MKSLQSVLQQSCLPSLRSTVFSFQERRVISLLSRIKERAYILEKFLVRSEISYYTWTEMTMDETTGYRKSSYNFHSDRSTCYIKLEGCSVYVRTILPAPIQKSVKTGVSLLAALIGILITDIYPRSSTHTKVVFREVLHPIRLEFGNVDFWGEGETGEPEKNLSEQSKEPLTKLINPLVARWEASAITTMPSLLP